MSGGNWESCATSKRNRLLAAIPREWRWGESRSQCLDVRNLPSRLLSEQDIAITELPPMDTLANIHAGVWSAEEVVRAYCHRAAISHQLVNCLTEIVFDQALNTARELDKFHHDTGTLKGPLHGLPFSMMDRFRVADTETAAGFVSWLGKKETADSESLIVKHMRSLGAIPICKTNLPQSMLLGETTNNIHGSTASPFNQLLSSGGAAGGEGALLAMKGSPIGWSTDIAGSTRIPAVLNNIYSLRASSGRLPVHGVASTNSGPPLCNCTVAMMSWDLPILTHVCKVTLGSPAFAEDPTCIAMPWRETRFLQSSSKKLLTFAIMYSDGHVRPQSPVERALKMVAQSLRRANYEIVKWEPPSHAPAVENLFRIIGADGAQEIRRELRASGEPPVPMLESWYRGSNTAVLSTSEFWDLCQKRQEYRERYHTYWQSLHSRTVSGRPPDGVILPVLPNAACVENTLTYFGYSAIANLLDFTAASFPVTFVDKAVDTGLTGMPLSEEDHSIQRLYDPTAFHGSPVGLQVMCRKLEEETALSLVHIISQALRLQS